LIRYEADVHDEDILCAAILHDTLEESDVTEKQIEKAFGKTVLDLVKEVTRGEPDAEMRKLPEKELWKLRNEAMLLEIDKMSDSAKIIKLADRCSNLTAALQTRTGEKLERYVRQSQAILDHIDRSISPPLWDRIQRLLATVESTLPPRRKNLKENGAANAITS
jgi:(p)ppGpp synthase/HD superfamily hydrolase